MANENDKKPRRSKFGRRTFLGGTGAAFLGSLISRPTQATDRNSDGGGSAADEIVSVRIYPAIGVARIGNSPDRDGYYIGPEVTDPSLVKAGEMRDLSGALKRQAARFRIYGYNAKGEVVREVTTETAQINWSVHMANKKAQWYRFTSALDVPEAAKTVCARRNPGVKDRRTLVIDPGPRFISGKNQKAALDGGKFLHHAVALGEIRTDELGRLLVLGGTGKAGSPEKKPIYNLDDADSFNNADGWYDDTSDGPVSATVQIGNRTLQALPAWAVVAPPNYAPNLLSWRTMYDLLMDVAVASGWYPEPSTTSFTKDVLPLLSRLNDLQWVNKGFALQFGAGAKLDFSDPKFIAQLCDPTANADLRRGIFNAFRLPQTENPALYAAGTKAPAYLRLWPMLYGDSYGTFDDSPTASFVISGVRLIHLHRWSAGDFRNDWNPGETKPNKLSEVPLAEQPAMLNKAALESCLADAFHPGCELTWPMRHASLFEKPPTADEALLFRLKRRPVKAPLAYDFGDSLTPAICLQANGPLDAQGPGDLTKWMALPWHGDTAFCRSGYEEKFDPYIQSFWPARVPNHVLSEMDYMILMDPSVGRDERLKAFQRRVFWVRNLPSENGAPGEMLYVTANFSELGVVEARPGPSDLPEIPTVVMVETLSPMNLKSAPVGGARGAPTAAGGDVWKTAEHRLLKRYPKRAEEVRAIFKELRGENLDLKTLETGGWKSLEQFVEFRLIKFAKRK